MLDWTRIAMFNCYFDESFDGRGDIVWAVAGWVGPESAWQFLNDRWDDVLCTYCLGDFHANQCEGGYRDFENWDQDRKDSLRHSLIDILEESRLAGISTAINFR